MISFKSNNLSLKYQRFKLSVCEHSGIRHEFLRQIPLALDLRQKSINTEKTATGSPVKTALGSLVKTATGSPVKTATGSLVKRSARIKGPPIRSNFFKHNQSQSNDYL